MITTYFTKATTHGIETFSALGKTIIKEATGSIHIQDAEFNADYRFKTLEDAMRWVCVYGFGAREVYINGFRVSKSLSDFTFGEVIVGQGGYINPVVLDIFWERSWGCPDSFEKLKNFVESCEEIAKQRRDQSLEGYGYDDDDLETVFSETPVEMEYVEFEC